LADRYAVNQKEEVFMEVSFFLLLFDLAVNFPFLFLSFFGLSDKISLRD
jgi:hypothetical protein